MADIQNNQVVTELIFKANLDALRDINKRISDVSKATDATKSEMKQAFKMSSEQVEMTRNLGVADTLMSKTGLSASDLASSLKRMRLQIKGGKIMAPFNKEMKMTDKLLKDLKKNAVRFNMSLLSVMFAGMALQRASSRAFRSLVTTYQKANEETEGLGKATWHLQAAWEFFKYSIIDALTQSPLFQTMVGWLVQFVQWLNKLSPETKTLIAIGIGVLFIVGTLLLVVGQIGLAVMGFKALGITGLSAILPIIGKVLLWLAISFLLYKFLSGFFSMFRAGTKESEKGASGLSKAIMFIGQVIRFIGNLVELGGKVMGMIFFNLADTVRILFIGIQKVVAEIFNAMLGNFTNFINTIISGINAALRGLAKLTGRDAYQIPDFKTGLKIDTSGYGDEIIRLNNQIRDRTMDLTLNTPTISEMWANADMSNLLPQTSGASTQTNLDMSGMTLNINGATEDLMNNADKLMDELSDKMLEKLNDKYSMNIGSNNG